MLKSGIEYLKRADYTLLFICFFCSTISVITLTSISFSLGDITTTQAVVQAVASIIGIIAAIIISTSDYRMLCELWPLHGLAAWGLVFLTAFIGYAPSGTTNKAWLTLPLGLSLQPTELAKISFILTFAMHLSMVHKKINEPGTLIKVLIHMLLPVGYVAVVQGDDGTALVFLLIGSVMLFCTGISYKYVLGALGSVLVLAPAVWFLDKNAKIIEMYQRNRILALFHPEDTKFATMLYQQNKGLISIGSGEIIGRGLFDTNHYAVPLAHNDFVFSYIAQCFGFVGAMTVLILIFFIIFKCYATAHRSADMLGSFICIGVSMVFLAQTFINVGMNLCIFPVVGVTLPFLTAGGTSVVMMYLSIGLVLSVYSHNKKTLFD